VSKYVNNSPVAALEAAEKQKTNDMLDGNSTLSLAQQTAMIDERSNHDVMHFFILALTINNIVHVMGFTSNQINSLR